MISGGTVNVFGKGDQFWLPKSVRGDRFWLPKLVRGIIFRKNLSGGTTFGETDFGVTVPWQVVRGLSTNGTRRGKRPSQLEH